MAYKACFACELLFEVDLGLGESTRCPQCAGVLSDYDPSAEELDGRADDVAPAPTQANQAIVRTMSYKGLADAVKAQIGQQGGQPARPVARPQPRARAPMPRGRASGSNSGARIPSRVQAPARGRGGLIPPRASAPPRSAPNRPPTEEMRSLSGDLGGERERPGTAPIASLNMSAAELAEDTPIPAAAPVAAPVPAGPAPVPARPAPVPARPAPVPARPAPVPARPAPIVPQAVAAADAPRGTKVLDSVVPDADATALDAAGAAVLNREDDSLIEDISMQSMHEDPSMLEDISLQSIADAPGDYDLPATVALEQDPNRPLPPMPTAKPATPVAPKPVSPFGAAPQAAPVRPAMPQPVAAAVPQPAVPQPAVAQPAMAQPAMPQPVMPRPAQPIAPQPVTPQGPPSPFAGAPAVGPAAVPIGAPADDEPSTGASAFAPVDFDHAAARKKSSKLPLIIALVVLVLGGAGAAVWFLVLAEPEPAPEPEVTAAPVELTWGEKLEAQIKAGEAPLPAVDAAGPLEETTWIAGGPEGMSTSDGLVTGMATSVIRAGAVQSDETADFVPVVQQKLAEASPAADKRLLLGFPAEMSADDFMRMAESGRRAGHEGFAMVVEQGAGSGTLGQLSFVLAPKGTPLPETGIVKVRIGTLGLHMTARDGQDARLPEGQAEGEPMPEPRVPMKGGALDFDGFSARLVALKTAQPAVDRVVIYPAPSTKVADLARLMSRIYQGSDGKKFAETALVP